jgi:flagellar biosynthesis/type III secretory pathway protein FliH
VQTNIALKPGEFLLKSDLGDVDGRHSSRIRQIHHALEKNA